MIQGGSGTNIGLGCAELELNNSDFSFLHPCRASRSGDNILVEHNAVNEFSVFDSTPDFFHYPDISEIDIGGCGGNEARNGIYSNGGKSGGVLRDDLSEG